MSSYLMVLPVRSRIHWGMGLFCFCARASFCLVRKDLCDCGGRGQWAMAVAVRLASVGRLTGIFDGCRGCLLLVFVWCRMD